MLSKALARPGPLSRAGLRDVLLRELFQVWRLGQADLAGLGERRIPRPVVAEHAANEPVRADPDGGREGGCRLMCARDTTPEDIRDFVADLRELI